MSDSAPPSGPRAREVEYTRVRYTLEVELETARGAGPMLSVAQDALHTALRGLAVPGAKVEGWTLRTVAEQREDDFEESLRVSLAK